MSTYRTKQGDMWDSIAYTQMGDTAYTDRLINLNRQYKDFYTLPAGLVLTLPEADPRIIETLPPWKKRVVIV